MRLQCHHSSMEELLSRKQVMIVRFYLMAPSGNRLMVGLNVRLMVERIGYRETVFKLLFTYSCL